MAPEGPVNRRGRAWVRPERRSVPRETHFYQQPVEVSLATGAGPDPSDPEPWRPGPDRGQGPPEVLNGVAVPNAIRATLPTRHPARG